MICKKCGAKNSDTRKKCFNCGNILVVPKVIEPEKREEKYEDFPDDTSFFQEENITVEPVVANSKKAPGAFQYKTKSTVEEETSEFALPSIENIVVEPVVPEVKENDISLSKTEKISKFENFTIDNKAYPLENDELEEDELTDDDYEILEEIYAEKRLKEKRKSTDYQTENIRTLEVDETTEQHFKTASQRRNTGFAVIIWILVLTFILVALFMGVLIYNYINTDNGQNIPPAIDTTSDLGIDPPNVTKLTDKQGVEYLHAVFKGTAGDRIYLECNNTYHTFVENELEIDLYLEDLFNSEYQFREDTIEANMHAYYVRGNKKYSCQSPNVKMSVPVAEIDLGALSEQNIKVYNETYNLKFWTATTATVDLNGQNITSAMNGTGSFNHKITVPENSSTTYYLTVTQPYHISRTEVFIITRDPLPVTLTIAANNEESQSDNTITLKCQTEENATITSNLPIVSLNTNELYNTVDVTLSLSKCEYGEIEALITASNSKGSSTKSHTFMYWPDENSITTKSDKFTSAVATNSAAYTKKNFVINSVKATKNTSANRFEGTVTLDGVEYELIFNNANVSSNVIIGNSYKIFAECTGTYENDKPLFRIWFIYNG